MLHVLPCKNRNAQKSFSQNNVIVLFVSQKSKIKAEVVLIAMRFYFVYALKNLSSKQGKRRFSQGKSI